MATPRRLIFGDVAELYDARRPGYPPELVDDLLRRAGLGRGDRALEVGAGTGKATVLFAARGIDVVAIEPSAEMAAVARRNFAAYPAVRIIESDFETWDPAGQTFALLYSAQAWHWVESEPGLRRAREALVPGGLLAAFWNRPAWGRSELRDEMAQAYERAAPDLEPDGPLHPGNQWSHDDEGWVAEMAGAPGFERAEVTWYRWHVDYSTSEYLGLLGTLSEIRLLAESERAALLDGVRTAIERHGGTLPMPMRTLVCLAWRA